METKQCVKCGVIYPHNNNYYQYTNKSKGILRGQCKICSREYRENNKKRINERNLLHYKKNREYYLKYKKEHEKNNIYYSQKRIYQKNNKITINNKIYCLNTCNESIYLIIKGLIALRQKNIILLKERCNERRSK